jgi:MFS family permease
VAPLPWLFGLAGVVALDARIITPILPAIATSLGVTTGEAGIAVTAYTLGYGILQLGRGPLSDRYGRVRVVRVFATAARAKAFCGAVGAAAVERIVDAGYLEGALAGCGLGLAAVGQLTARSR